MSNLSYCKFRNTEIDLSDCVYTLEDMTYDKECDLSIDEKQAAKNMYDLCKEYIEYYEELLQENRL